MQYNETDWFIDGEEAKSRQLRADKIREQPPSSDTADHSRRQDVAEVKLATSVTKPGA